MYDYVAAFKEANESRGFNFDNVQRNAMLISKSSKAMPTTMKTGTTICGIRVKNAVVLGADTRATEGPIVADKNCEKLHKVTDDIWCAGAGTSADLVHVMNMVASNLELHRLSTGKPARVATVITFLSQLLFKYQGHIGCAVVLGGMDFNGPQLFTIHPHGSTDRVPFCAMGSGSLHAMSILENHYEDDMTIEQGKALVCQAIRAGIFNDLGSGSNVDIVTIEGRKKTNYLRNYDVANPRLYRSPNIVKFNKGTTAILREKVQEFKKNVVVEDTEMVQAI